MLGVVLFCSYVLHTPNDPEGSADVVVLPPQRTMAVVWGVLTARVQPCRTPFLHSHQAIPSGFMTSPMPLESGRIICLASLIVASVAHMPPTSHDHETYSSENHAVGARLRSVWACSLVASAIRVSGRMIHRWIFPILRPTTIAQLCRQRRSETATTCKSKANLSNWDRLALTSL